MKSTRHAGWPLWIASMICCLAPQASAAEPAGAPPAPLPIDKPQIAYWDFDDEFGDTCRDSSRHGYQAF